MRMFYWLLAVSGILMSACNTSSVFGPQSSHARYSRKLNEAGLADTALGREWFGVAKQSLGTSVVVTTPYSEAGFFAADRPGAMGIRFQPKRGQKVTISVIIKPAHGARLFLELWRVNGNEMKLLQDADSALTIIYEQKRDEQLLLRLQPELLVSVSYKLSIVAEPALAFPVQGTKGVRVGSYWGEPRDGGKRRHEGIDIFARFRTPLLATCDGVITRVEHNTVGGKTVWLNAAEKSYSIYYAHLDSQMVQAWQQVKRGDTLGLMGNTGNAKNTPAHLHFGIYDNGPIDPLPFVQQVSKVTPKIKGDTTLLDAFVIVGTRATLFTSPRKDSTGTPLLPGTLVRLQAATANYYKVQLPGASTGFVEVKMTSPLKVLKTERIDKQTLLFAEADSTSALIATLQPATILDICGVYLNYSYVRHKTFYGWIKMDQAD